MVLQRRGGAERGVGALQFVLMSGRASASRQEKARGRGDTIRGLESRAGLEGGGKGQLHDVV